jgi:selenocysteine lyase/cysteine desulfurase
MKYVYLDNGATSFPKAPGVAESISDYILNVGTNIGRGDYDLSYKAQIQSRLGQMFVKLSQFWQNSQYNVWYTKSDMSQQHR